MLRLPSQGVSRTTSWFSHLDSAVSCRLLQPDGHFKGKSSHRSVSSKTWNALVLLGIAIVVMRLLCSSGSQRKYLKADREFNAPPQAWRALPEKSWQRSEDYSSEAEVEQANRERNEEILIVKPPVSGDGIGVGLPQYLGVCNAECDVVRDIVFNNESTPADVGRLQSLNCVRFIAGKGFCDSFVSAGRQRTKKFVFTREYMLAARTFFNNVSETLSQNIDGHAVFFPTDSGDALTDNEIQRLWSAKVPLLSHAIRPRATKSFVFMPDFHFIRTSGFLSQRKRALKDTSSFETRAPKVFWRGATNFVGKNCLRADGIMPEDTLKESQRRCNNSLRVRVCQEASRVEWIDALIMEAASCCRYSKSLLETQGIFGDRAPEVEWLKFRGILEIDGLVNAWGNFWRMLSGSVIFRVESEYTNYYVEKQVAWEHYVPVMRNLSDLHEKTRLVLSQDKDDIARLSSIAQNARQLMLGITYESEVERVKEALLNRWRS